MSNRRKIRRSNAQRLNEAAQDIDAAFFEEHPGERSYTRPATSDELAATSYPPGTRVYVQLLGHNHRVRAFIAPESRRN